MKVALKLGSNSSRHAWQWCFLGTVGHAIDGGLDIILSLVLGNDLPSKGQVAKFGLAVCMGLGWGFR